MSRSWDRHALFGLIFDSSPVRPIVAGDGALNPSASRLPSKEMGMPTENLVLKALTAHGEQEAKRRGQLAYDPMASYGEILKKFDLPSRVAAAVNVARPATAWEPATFDLGGIQPRHERTTVDLNGSPRRRERSAFDINSFRLSQRPAAFHLNPAIQALIGIDGKTMTATRMLNAQSGSAAFPSMLQESGLFAKALRSAAEQAGVATQLAAAGAVFNRIFPSVAASRVIQREDPTSRFAHQIKALTGSLDPQSVHGPFRRSAMPRSNAVSMPRIFPAVRLGEPRTPIMRAVWRDEQITTALRQLVMAPSLAPAAPLPSPQSETTDLEVRQTPSVEVSPQNLAEVGALAEARAHRLAAEELLRAEGLDYELEHLLVIPRRLADAEPGREHAALSASFVLRSLANRVFPPRPKKWTSRFDTEHDVGGDKYANRLVAFIEIHLPFMSTHEHKRLIGMIEFVLNWTGEGHHKPHDRRLGAMAYRDFLMILAYVARARQVERGR
jgi:hypothetical protein